VIKIENSEISGLLFFKMNKFEDERGFFARNYCRSVIRESRGFESVDQANLSVNKFKGTIRGFHYQTNGHEESKTVTVLSGSLHYKIIDLRKNSESYLRVVSFDLKALDLVVQVPKGCAPAFQTLEDNVMLHYYVSNSYSPENESGIRFNDPFFNFKWPLPQTVVSKRDSNFEDFNPDLFIGLKS
jgi:dTDP-4-dehydrorhamnose 3,5-epimerase